MDAVALIYHGRDKESAAFKVGYQAARLIMAKIIEKGALPSLLPLSSVSAARTFSVTSYYELAFLRPAQVAWLQQQSSEAWKAIDFAVGRRFRRNRQRIPPGDDWNAVGALEVLPQGEDQQQLGRDPI